MASLRCTELLTPGPATAVAGLLDVALPAVADPPGLPLLWHWFYLLERPSQHILGEDGHPSSGAVSVPPAPGLRRMFAGGRVESLAPLTCDSVATRYSETSHSVTKTGTSGPLTFVTVRHEIHQDGRLAVVDEQDLVYRTPVPPGAGPPPVSPPPVSPQLVSPQLVSPPPDPASGLTESSGWQIALDPVLLFRFSALTYNSHRIHFDRDYCRDVEGYPGLVVHGPLQALAMCEAVRREWPDARVVRFEYRLVAPLFDHEGMSVGVSRDADRSGAVVTEVRDGSGRQTARGAATVAI